MTIKPGDKIGFDLEADAKRFNVTESGIVIVSNVGHAARIED